MGHRATRQRHFVKEAAPRACRTRRRQATKPNAPKEDTAP